VAEAEVLAISVLTIRLTMNALFGDAAARVALVDFDKAVAFDDAALLIAAVARCREAALAPSAVRVALIREVSRPAALLAAAKVISFVLIAARDATFGLAADRVICTMRVTAATPGVAVVLVAMARLMMAARLGDAAAKVISLVLTT
jgi:hypothetical protein